jgi:hypothetical protein
LSKCFLGCHRTASSSGRQAPPDSTGNSEEPNFLVLRCIYSNRRLWEFCKHLHSHASRDDSLCWAA